MRYIIRISIIIAVVFLPGFMAYAQQTKELLKWAGNLQMRINRQNTTYRHKDNVVSWGDDGTTLQCYADCSGFINALIKKTFSWEEDDFKKAFGHKRMYGYHYYQAITTGNHFQLIKNISQVQPGDIIAIQYADRSEHDDNTGHVMLVSSLPQSYKPSAIVLPNTLQYIIDVIDCSKTPHGKNDSRRLPDGSDYSGLGKGSFRIYTDRQGNIVAYSWSDGKPKEGFDPYENQLAVGRFFK
ncbi:MAG: hypothetical protein EKK37_10485 [Sphingobacteriales bacterium]|nr:MAG: hypothetical protein EKK37_10485 [Sphingobacteriales bacterium]